MLSAGKATVKVLGCAVHITFHESTVENDVRTSARSMTWVASLCGASDGPYKINLYDTFMLASTFSAPRIFPASFLMVSLFRNLSLKEAKSQLAGLRAIFKRLIFNIIQNKYISLL